MTTPRTSVVTISTYLIGSLALLMTGVLLYHRLAPVFANPWPREYDSFFYLTEWRSRLTTGEGYYRDFSPFFLLTTSIGWVARLGEVTLYDLILSLSFLSFLIGGALLAFRASGVMASALMALSIATSEVVWRVQDTFLRQSFGVGLVTLGAALVVHTGRVGRIFGIALLVAGALSHAFAAVVAVGLLFALYPPPTASLQRGVSWVVGGGAVLVVAAYPYWDRLKTSIAPKLSSMWSIGLERGWLSTLESAEIPVAIAIAALIGVVLLLRYRRAFPFLPLLLLVTMLFIPIWRETSTAQFRFTINGVIVTILLVTVTGLSLGKRGGTLAALLLYGALLGVRITTPSLHRFTGPQLAPETLLAHREQLLTWLGPEACLQAPHGIGFRLTYFLNLRAGMRPPRSPLCRERYVVRIVKNAFQERECVPLSYLHTSEGRPATCLALEPKVVVIRISRPGGTPPPVLSPPFVTPPPAPQGPQG